MDGDGLLDRRAPAGGGGSGRDHPGGRIRHGGGRLEPEPARRGAAADAPELDAATSTRAVYLSGRTNTFGAAFFAGFGITTDPVTGQVSNAGAATTALRSIQTFEDKVRGTADAIAFARDRDRADTGQKVTRLQALEMYTVGSAWFSEEENELGSFEVGKKCDLAVLSDDYLKVSDEKLRKMTSLLTLQGGRVVHATGPFADLA